MIIIIVIIIVIVFVQERELIIMPNCLFYFELGKEKNEEKHGLILYPRSGF